MGECCWSFMRHYETDVCRVDDDETGRHRPHCCGLRQARNDIIRAKVKFDKRLDVTLRMRVIGSYLIDQESQESNLI